VVTAITNYFTTGESAMTPDDQKNHGGREPQPRPSPPLPKPLLPNATVTIYFDGLIYAAFNQPRRLYQTAVHTEAEKHHTVIEVKLRGDDTLLFPTRELPWDSDHRVVKARAPFWLYVDSGRGLNEKEFSASLHMPSPPDEQSYDRILNFEQLYERPLPLRPERFAEFNFPHGISYSAANDDANLKRLGQDEPSSAAVFVRKINVSTLGATDIDAVSNGDGRKFIVLANNKGADEFFRFELQPGKHYDIQILNQPIDGHTTHSPEEHFLQFYELFDLRSDEKKFLVEPAAPRHLSEPNSPPCIGGRGSAQTGLGG
jgi:hypothetical protein